MEALDTLTESDREADIVNTVVEAVSAHRRFLTPETDVEDLGLETLRIKTLRYVSSSEPIHFVLPAFPCKSVSRRKVLGELPDMAEILSLTFLNDLMNKIGLSYPPGAKLTICSDGRVFSPIVRVKDEVIDSYSQELNRLIKQLGLTAIEVFCLEDVFSGDPAELRDNLLTKFGSTIDDIKIKAKANPSLMSTFRGVKKFMTEEGRDWNEQNGLNQTNNQLDKESKNRAWEVIRASQAWSSLVDNEVFPNAVRLSIHPQGPESSKFGIKLLQTEDNFLTPWHSVAVLSESGASLMRHSELDSLSGFVSFIDDRPSHFINLGPKSR